MPPTMLENCMFEAYIDWNCPEAAAISAELSGMTRGYHEQKKGCSGGKNTPFPGIRTMKERRPFTMRNSDACLKKYVHPTNSACGQLANMDEWHLFLALVREEEEKKRLAVSEKRIFAMTGNGSGFLR